MDYRQVGGTYTPEEIPLTLVHKAVKASPYLLYSNLMSSSLTFLHGKASLHKRFTAILEEEVSLMFLKHIWLILTQEGPYNKSMRRFVKNLFFSESQCIVLHG
ncbi:hypothetical protein AMTRI_Chr05g70750 [Amborella trichopoda]